MVEVDTKTCLIGPNKEGGVGHSLDYSARSRDLAILAIFGMFPTYSYARSIAKIAEFPNLLGTGPSTSMLSVTNVEGNNNNIGNTDSRQSRFVMPGLLVEVDTEMCHAGPNKEGGIRHLLGHYGDGTFSIKNVLHGRV